jgi:hypothetical protein
MFNNVGSNGNNELGGLGNKEISLAGVYEKYQEISLRKLEYFQSNSRVRWIRDKGSFHYESYSRVQKQFRD